MKKNSSESESERPTTSGVPGIPNQVSWTFSSVLSVLFQGIPVWVSLFLTISCFYCRIRDHTWLWWFWHFQGGDILKCCISLACVSWLTLWNQSVYRDLMYQSSVLSLSVAPVRVWLRLRTLSLVKLTPMFYLHRQYHHLMWQCCFVFVCYLLKYTDNQYSRSVFQTQFYSYDLWTLSLSLLAAEDLLLKNTQTDKDLSETKCSVCSFETKAFHFVLFFISIIYIYIFLQQINTYLWNGG